MHGVRVLVDSRQFMIHVKLKCLSDRHKVGSTQGPGQRGLSPQPHLISTTTIYSGGLNPLPYLLPTSVSQAVIKDFSTNYMTALGLNQACTSIKLLNTYSYNIVLICSFRSITGNITDINKNLIRFSLVRLYR